LKLVLGVMAKRGTIIHLTVLKENLPEDIYLLNTEAEREAAENIKKGKMTLTGLKTGRAVERSAPVAPVDIDAPVPADTPDIFTLYEENIGMLTPIIADRLKEAEAHFPKSWIAAAISEAAVGNKRNWRYILTVLERWGAEGKSDGTHQRNPEKSADKYIQGKYGHTVQR
jgi:DNA replication protein